MNLKIYPRKLSGEVGSISSKSDAHRILICSAFCKKETTIRIGQISKDIETTISCLEKMGAKIIKISSDVFKLMPIKFVNQDIKINVKESGATLRFLLPLIAALSINVEIECEGRLSVRPIEQLLFLLEKHGANYSSRRLPLRAGGKIGGGRYVVDGDISSQFISGILLASPLINENVEVVTTNKCESFGYINMTINTMKKFGISVLKKDSCHFVVKNQNYVSPMRIVVEGDWSNSAFWLCAGAIGGNIQVSNLNINSFQPDKQIVSILEQIGAHVTIDKDKFTVKKENLNGVEVDVSNIPDLVPILAVVASVSNGKTRLYNARRLRFKESDRLQSTAAMLKNLGANIIETEDSLEIIGKSRLKGGIVSSFNDHRIVMAAAIASCVCESEVIINDFEAVAKSYPTFFEDYKSLGGDFVVV